MRSLCVGAVNARAYQTLYAQTMRKYGISICSSNICSPFANAATCALYVRRMNITKKKKVVRMIKQLDPVLYIVCLSPIHCDTTVSYHKSIVCWLRFVSLFDIVAIREQR